MCRNEPSADYDPNVSAYLQRPLRSYEEAVRDVQRAERKWDHRGETPDPLQRSNLTCDVGPHDNDVGPHDNKE